MIAVLNNKVYLLCHSYECKNDEQESEEVKILGIYTSKEAAKLAVERYYKLDGFKNHPKECFAIDGFTLDKDESWVEGFINWEEASGIEN